MHIGSLHYSSAKPAIGFTTHRGFLALVILLMLTFINAANSFALPQSTATNQSPITNKVSSSEIDQLLAQALKVKSSNKDDSARIIKQLELIPQQLSYRQQGELTYLTAYNAYLNGERHKAVALHKSMLNSKLFKHRIRARRTLLNLYLVEQNFIKGGELIPQLLQETEEIEDTNLKGDVYEVIAYYYNELNQAETALTFLSLINTENYSPRDHCLNVNHNTDSKLLLSGYLAEQSYIDNAIKTCEQAGEHLSANLTRSDVAINLIAQQKYQLALDMLLPYLSKVEAINYNNLSLNFYSYIATAYFHLNDYDQALLFANKAENVFILMKYHKAYINLYSTLSALHKKLGNHGKALQYLYLYQQKLTVALDVDQQKQLASAQIDHNVYGTYRYRDKLIKDKQQAEQRNKDEFNIMLGFISKFESERMLFALQVFTILLLGAIILRIRHVQISTNEKNRLDPLTKLFNRQRFVDLAATIAYQHKKWQVDLSLLVVNIDNFRGFNQIHSFDKGDLALKLIAHTLRNYVDKDENIARTGADEFSLLLSHCDAEQALQVAQSIHLEIAALSKKLRIEDDAINVSIGLSDSALSEYSLKHLLADTSKALRKAKVAGGNNTCCFDKTMTDRDKYKVDTKELKYIYD